MFFINRSRLYAFVLSMSSALLLSSLPYTATAGEKRDETSSESAKAQVGRKFKTDFNLMQNLMMKLEQVNAEPKTIAVETKGKLKRDKNPDEKWIEDEIGVRDASVKKPKPLPTKPQPIPEAKFNKTRLRVRSR